MSTRRFSRWWPLGPLLILSVMTGLDMTGRLRPMIANLAARTPDFWSALAAWIAVAVAIATVIVAGRYARQQVEKAQDQVREAQQARVAQARQAREAIEIQTKIAAEQAEPVVVIYTELNSQEIQFTELIIKNFGPTPAYNVRVLVDPELKASPNNDSDGKLAEVTIPFFPILAPGQEWRTGWDFYPARQRYNAKRDRLSLPADELTEDAKLEIEYLQSVDEFPLEELVSIHKATVTFDDSQHESHKTEATLDYELFSGTSRFTVKTIHNLFQLMERELPKHNTAVASIAAELGKFGTEHNGVWIYGSGDLEESDFRESIRAADARESREMHDFIQDHLNGNPRRNRGAPSASTPVEIPIENANVNDFLVPAIGGQPAVERSWRIAYTRGYPHPRLGVVHELFSAKGGKHPAIRQSAGTRVYVVRAET